MFAMVIGGNTLKRYKLQWYSFAGKRRYISKTKVLHSISLQDVKQRAKGLFNSTPDFVQRI